jgi:hypothetical protein
MPSFLKSGSDVHRLPLSRSESPYLAWALSLALSQCEPEEEELLLSLLSRCESLAPYAPLRSLSEWRSSVLSRSSL